MSSNIAPCLWFDDQAEAAAELYTAVFPDSSVTGRSRFPEGFDNPGGKPRGSVMTVEVDLAGTPFTLLNGGPMFTINPTVSFFVHVDDESEAERIAQALGEGGAFLMPLDAYPWSPRYAWVQDRFGVSWQVMTSPADRVGPMIVPSLMFVGEVQGRAEEALSLYASVFPDGSVDVIEHYTADEGPEATVKYGQASIGDQQLCAMDNHLHQGAGFSEAVSLQVICRDQAEVDRFWSALSEGGDEGPCGWLKDRFGLSWQVVPKMYVDLVAAGEGVGPGYERALRAMLEMTKLDIAALTAAYEGHAG